MSTCFVFGKSLLFTEYTKPLKGHTMTLTVYIVDVITHSTCPDV